MTRGSVERADVKKNGETAAPLERRTPMLQATGLSVRYGRKLAFEDVTLAARGGRVKTHDRLLIDANGVLDAERFQRLLAARDLSPVKLKE